MVDIRTELEDKLSERRRLEGEAQSL